MSKKPDKPESKRMMDFVAEDRNWTDRIYGEWRGARLWDKNWGFLSTGYEQLDTHLREEGRSAGLQGAPPAAESAADVFTLPVTIPRPESVYVPADVYFWQRAAADAVQFNQEGTVIR